MIDLLPAQSGPSLHASLSDWLISPRLHDSSTVTQNIEGYEMPFVRIELSHGRSWEQNEKCVEGVTKLMSETLTSPIESIDIVFMEITEDNLARAGKFYASLK